MSKPYWKYKADISWVVDNPTMKLEERADKIFRFLQGLPPFRRKEHRTVLTDVVSAAISGPIVFEEKIQVLYNFCDYHRVWLSKE